MAKTNNTESSSVTSNNEATEAVVDTKTKSNPPLERNYLPSPDSPWVLLHSEDISDTYAFEIKNVGVIIRTDSAARNSISTVFIPNVELSQIKR